MTGNNQLNGSDKPSSIYCCINEPIFPPHSIFKKQLLAITSPFIMPSFDPSTLPSLQGKVAIVTGGTSGL
jgi:hypothetical protein